MFVPLRLVLTFVFEVKEYGTNSHLKVRNTWVKHWENRIMHGKSWRCLQLKHTAVQESCEWHYALYIFTRLFLETNTLNHTSDEQINCYNYHEYYSRALFCTAMGKASAKQICLLGTWPHSRAYTPYELQTAPKKHRSSPAGFLGDTEPR